MKVLKEVDFPKGGQLQRNGFVCIKSVHPFTAKQINVEAQTFLSANFLPTNTQYPIPFYKKIYSHCLKKQKESLPRIDLQLLKRDINWKNFLCEKLYKNIRDKTS